MHRFIATVNVPGYLPHSDDSPAFKTAKAAWEYLLDERCRDENQTDDPEYSDTVSALSYIASDHHQHGNAFEDVPTEASGEGTVYGATPGHDDSFDIGLAYTVTRVEMKPQGVLWACVDCYQYHHGISAEERGEPYPTDPEPWALWLGDDDHEITAGLEWHEHADPEECERRFRDGEEQCECTNITFSSDRCGGCGFHWAGEREAFTWWGIES
jgi:hypothetical protein